MINFDTATDLEIFNWKIIGIMKDYGLSMKQALQWDFESWVGDVYGCITDAAIQDKDYIEIRFKWYLLKNKLTFGESKFYWDVFFATSNDMILTR